MPGSSPSEAVENYLQPLRESLFCITDKPITNFGGYHLSKEAHTATFVGTPPMAFLGQSGLAFLFSQRYEIIYIADTEEYRVSTRGYIYQVYDENKHEIFAYHWHPDALGEIKQPHLHFRRGALVKRPELTKTHMPSGRVALESVIEYLIEEFRVQPRRGDYKRILDLNRRRFELHKSW